MVSSEKFNAPKLVNGSENRCSFIFDKKIRRTSLVSSYSRYGLRYERLQVIRKIPAARDQAAEECLRELASQLPRREHRQPRAHHAGGSRRRLLGRNPCTKPAPGDDFARRG